MNGIVDQSIGHSARGAMRHLDPIHGTSRGTTAANAEGLSVKAASGPALALCRKLLGAGFDPNRPLHCYRAATLCLAVSSIGWDAGHTIAETPTGNLGLRRYRAPDWAEATAPVRQTDRPATPPA
jgi:hypothetical protein